MEQDIIKKNWKQIKAKLTQHWGKFTNEEVETMEGNYEELEGHLQRVYGYQKEEARSQINSFIRQHGWKVEDDNDDDQF